MSSRAVALEVPAGEVPCRCPGCAAGLAPFSVEHFERWAFELVLDNGEPWRVASYFLAYVEDLYAGLPGAPVYPEDWLVVPEGNAKTTGLAGLGLHHVEHVSTAMVPWAAASREQAEVGYRQGEGLVLRTPRLRSVFKTQEGYRRIKRLSDGGRLQVFAADDRTGDGIIPGRLAIIDELHRQRDLRLYRTWRGKLGKRQAQLATISTAGEPGGEFEETRERIRQTADDVRRDGSFLRAAGGGVVLHEWAVPEGGDVEDMAAVKAANPFDGITVEALAEKRASPTMTVEHWRRFVCNLPTRSVASAITEAEWERARVDEVIPAGERVWAGLDLGWKYDTTALVPLWAPRLDFRLLGPAAILTPPRDGSVLDPKLVEAAIEALHSRNPIHTLVMDTSNGEQLARWVEDELGIQVIDRGQTNSFKALDYSRWMEGLREGWLLHVGDAGLTRHVLNATARQLPGGDSVFDRPASSRTVTAVLQRSRVIDALVAAAMAHTSAVGELAAGGAGVLLPPVFV